jgi:hypothetical protein
LAALCALSLAGYVLAAKVDARRNYETSTAAYHVRINANSANPQVCEGKQLAAEADERAYYRMVTIPNGV